MYSRGYILDCPANISLTELMSGTAVALGVFSHFGLSPADGYKRDNSDENDYCDQN